MPSLPPWVPYPIVVWFVIEGIALGVVGFLIRDYLGPLLRGLVTLGNVILFVGSVTAIFGGLAWLVLTAVNR
ncbi:MAG: hypothetical protein ABEH59_09715 [Halobacteriales archaeon]